MATANRKLSKHNMKFSSNSADFKIGIVVSEWNEKITLNLLKGAKKVLLSNGIKETNIDVQFVPGAFELPLGCQLMCEKGHIDGIIAIGAIIKGETKHFDFICSGTTQGIKDVNLKYNTPVSFCVLTDNNEQQSIDRSGGIYGNKGIESALSCLKMIELKKSLL